MGLDGGGGSGEGDLREGGGFNGGGGVGETKLSWVKEMSYFTKCVGSG